MGQIKNRGLGHAFGRTALLLPGLLAALACTPKRPADAAAAQSDSVAATAATAATAASTVKESRPGIRPSAPSGRGGPPKPASARALAKPAPELPALDSQKSALERQLMAGWGWRSDKDGQVRAPLADHRHWKRIRLWNVDHLTAFKYTDDHHLVTAVFAVETDEPLPTSRHCMEAFEARGLGEMKKRKVSIGAINERHINWRGKPVVVHQSTGSARLFFSKYEFRLAWATYPAFDQGCLAYATVVLSDGSPELEEQVLERWIKEGLRRVDVRSAELPYRH